MEVPGGAGSYRIRAEDKANEAITMEWRVFPSELVLGKAVIGTPGR